jgi:hypothetical protein
MKEKITRRQKDISRLLREKQGVYFDKVKRINKKSERKFK